MEGQAFMFTPGGSVPIAQDGTPLAATGISPAEMSPAAPPSTTVAYQPVRQLPAVAVEPPRFAPLAPKPKPRDIVKAAKARAAEIRAELRVMKRLEKELAELDRLVAAAKQKPVALVRNIDHARQRL